MMKTQLNTLHKANNPGYVKRSKHANNEYPKEYLSERLTHSENKDLALLYDRTLDGYDLMDQRGPLVFPYIKQLIHTVEYAFNHHSKVFALRCDLYFPKAWSLDRRLNRKPILDETGQALLDSKGEVQYQKQAYHAKDYFSRFLRALDYQLIEKERTQARRVKKTKFEQFEFVKALEEGKQKDNRGLHYHVLLLFSGQKFRRLGDFSLKNLEQSLKKPYLSSMIIKAWASALFGYEKSVDASIEMPSWGKGLENAKAIEQVIEQSLVFFSGAWTPQSDKKQMEQMRREVIFAGSYLCKAATKRFIYRTHPFRCSQTLKVTERPYRASKTHYHQGNEQLPLITASDIQNYPLALPPTLAPLIKTQLDQLGAFLKEALRHHHIPYLVRFQLSVAKTQIQDRAFYQPINQILNDVDDYLRRAYPKDAQQTSELFVAQNIQKQTNSLYRYDLAIIMDARIAQDKFVIREGLAENLLNFWSEFIGQRWGLSDEQARKRISNLKADRLDPHALESAYQGQHPMIMLAFMATSEHRISRASQLSFWRSSDYRASLKKQRVQFEQASQTKSFEELF